VKTIALCCAVSLLISCATNPPLTSNVETVTATKIIGVPCVDDVDIKPLPKVTIRDPAKADPKQLEQGIGADAIAFQQYATTARGLLLKCSTAQPKESNP
jgi:hypothetical protein